MFPRFQSWGLLQTYSPEQMLRPNCFPRLQSWGRLQTYSPEQMLRPNCLSDHPLVRLEVLLQLETVSPIVNRKVVGAHEYYVG